MAQEASQRWGSGHMYHVNFTPGAPLGLTINTSTTHCMVQSVEPGPGHDHGVAVNDVLAFVDGHSMKGKGVHELASELRYAQGFSKDLRVHFWRPDSSLVKTPPTNCEGKYEVELTKSPQKASRKKKVASKAREAVFEDSDSKNNFDTENQSPVVKQKMLKNKKGSFPLCH